MDKFKKLSKIGFLVALMEYLAADFLQLSSQNFHFR